MTVTDCDGNPITLPALVQSPNTKRVYHVMKIKADGHLRLWQHGFPKIDNADPRNWRLVPRLVEVRRDAA
jgi:hypothetical protein